jgi:hypothetical protein
MCDGIAVDLFLRLFSGQMEWDLHFCTMGHPFHPGILETQTIPIHIYIDAIGVPQEVPDKFK